MKRFFPVFLLFVLPFFSHSQNSRKIDSLLTLLKTAKEDTNKVKQLNKISSEYIAIDSINNAMNYANAALQIAQNLNFKKGIANSYSCIGHIYYLQDNYIKTIEYWLKALNIAEELKD